MAPIKREAQILDRVPHADRVFETDVTGGERSKGLEVFQCRGFTAAIGSDQHDNPTYLGEVESKFLNPTATGEASEPTEGEVLKLHAMSSNRT